MGNRLKRALLFALAVTLTLACSGSFAAAQTKKRAETGKPAAAATAIKLPVVREVDLAALRALLQRETTAAAPAKPRPLLVNFWATWCEPCREEFPDLVKIDREFGSQAAGGGRLDFITVSLDDVADIGKDVPQYLQRMNARMPAYLLNVDDPEQVINLVDPTWSGALPATFLFDARGTLVFKHMGRVKPDELREAIRKVTSDN